MSTQTLKEVIQLNKSGFYTFTLTKDFQMEIMPDCNVEVLVKEEGITKVNGTINVAQNSQCRILFMNESEQSNVKLDIHQKQDSNLHAGFYELNETPTNLYVRTHLDEQNASATLISTSIASSKKDFDIECIHHAPHTNSEMKNFEISNAQANYKIRACGTIEKGAYQSKSHQMTRILTTSEQQRSVAIPVLLIDENDVEASHANSMGKMDEAYLYYLQSRGIDEKQAKELLTLSYLLPISEVLENEETNQMITQKIRSRAGL